MGNSVGAIEGFDDGRVEGSGEGLVESLIEGFGDGCAEGGIEGIIEGCGDRSSVGGRVAAYISKGTHSSDKTIPVTTLIAPAPASETGPKF